MRPDIKSITERWIAGCKQDARMSEYEHFVDHAPRDVGTLLEYIRELEGFIQLVDESFCLFGTPLEVNNAILKLIKKRTE